LKPSSPRTEIKPIPISIPQKDEKLSPETVQAPIPLDTDINFLEVEIDPTQLDISIEPIDNEKIELQNVLMNKKPEKIEPRYDKTKLHNIFSGTEQATPQKPVKPATAATKPISVPDEPIFEVISASDDEPEKSNSAAITIYPEDDKPEIVALEVDKSVKPVKQPEQKVDPETLYQELINLEGKRYSLERNIRDLKRDRENNKISDAQYKSKLNNLVKELQIISKRIEDIRSHLD